MQSPPSPGSPTRRSSPTVIVKLNDGLFLVTNSKIELIEFFEFILTGYNEDGKDFLKICSIPTSFYIDKKQKLVHVKCIAKCGGLRKGVCSVMLESFCNLNINNFVYLDLQ